MTATRPSRAGRAQFCTNCRGFHGEREMGECARTIAATVAGRPREPPPSRKARREVDHVGAVRDSLFAVLSASKRQRGVERLEDGVDRGQDGGFSGGGDAHFGGGKEEDEENGTLRGEGTGDRGRQFLNQPTN
jgi:hypothetical protein